VRDFFLCSAELVSSARCATERWPARSGDDDDVAIVSTSTPEERNAEKRKHAIDLEAEDVHARRYPYREVRGEELETCRGSSS
jgi:hypothetical protein